MGRGIGGAARKKGEGGGREPWKGASVAAATGQEPEPSGQRCPVGTRQRCSAHTQRCMCRNHEEGGISEACTWPRTCWMTELRSSQGVPRDRALGHVWKGQKKEGWLGVGGARSRSRKEWGGGGGRLEGRGLAEGDGWGGAEERGTRVAAEEVKEGGEEEEEEEWCGGETMPVASSVAQEQGALERHKRLQTGQRTRPEE